MQWTGRQDAECCRVRARRFDGIACPPPCTICAAPRGDALNLQERRMALSCSWCTFLLMDHNLREGEFYSKHPEVPARGGLACRTTVTFWLGLNKLNKTLKEVKGQIKGKLLL